ncbi:MAG: ShlB/FhaC/HecB family hemolysin secretion/activation protein [Rhodoferax sp.]|uniref:ShlB/FhaC/HecB family hemolysin secretion/activation protein n=1 Tax=Rhodoferax sp. TaxID=50421 RepID=UPI002611C5A6|nr:ShlB/FhaC/HecB family hemolysin secretion/activation protein [Rhodoferax sp.]MDD5336742.1 ShlB/FhaC/HecB family hemolysin secretion/activation protein [Rhodoferax sp.]
MQNTHHFAHFPRSSIFRAVTLTLLAAGAATAVSAAPAAPDAGQISRELQQQPAFTATPSAKPLRVPGDSAVGKANGAARLAVQSIRVQGSTVFSAAELEALVADLLGTEHSLAELDAGVARISAYYRERGYLVARAYLPAQDIQSGALVIKVLEGVLDQQKLSNPSRLSDARVQSYLSDVKTGEVIQARHVDRALLLLGDTPGVGAARASLQPGASVGSSDLLVELDPAQAYAANVELDNYGNRYTGEYRAGAALSLNSPLGIGDLFSARLISSGSGMSYARLAYQVPVGASGLKMGAAVGDTRYKLGQDFASLQAHGTASSGSVYASYPFIRSQQSNLSGTLSWEDKKLVDQTDVPASTTDKQVRLSTIGLAGSRQDALGAGGMTSVEVSLASGRLSMDAVSQALDAAPSSAQSQGAFGKFSYSLNRLQSLGAKDSLSLSLLGQLANKNLASSEKFALGGANGVRAYPQGEGSGDQGWITNLEWRHSVAEQMQGVLFFDAGSVDINHSAYTTASNSRSIAGAGFGLNGQIGRLRFKTALAWRTRGGSPTSELASVDRNPRLWAQLSLGL